MIATAHRINTTLDEETYKKAVLHSISWAEALKTGILVMVDGTSMTKEQVLHRIEEYKNKSKYYQDILNQLEGQELKDTALEEKTKQHIGLLKECSDAINKDIKFLFGVTRRWNKTTKMLLEPEELHRLCKKFERGKIQ